ncbi:MAG: TonB family protein [Polyangiaceae bacterium]
MRAGLRHLATCVLALTASGLSLGVARTASAQPAPAPAAPKPVFVMPKPLAPLVAAYPDGAEGDASVIVRVVVETDGSVSDVTIVEGKEPFAASALKWARTFKFAPATRDGVPIKAAIRAEVKFTAPAPIAGPGSPATGDNPADNHAPANPAVATPGLGNNPSPNKPSGGAGASGTATGTLLDPNTKSAGEPIDINVNGDQAPPGGSTMSRAEVRLLPGAFGDPFRAVETQPGVVPIATGLPYFFVRGAPPGNVGYLLDGIRVPLLYHLGLGPSVVHPAIVDRVDLYPGGYPASLGRFAGAFVSGETRAPRPDINAEAQIRLVDAGAMVEVPFDSGRGSALVGGRYSYTGLFFSLVQSDIKLDYWDYQARLTYDVTPKDTVTLFAFGARDYFGTKAGSDLFGGPDTKKDRTIVDTTFHRLDLRYDRKLGPGSTFRQAFTFGYDLTGFEGGGTRDTMIATRSELRYTVSPTVVARAGMDAAVDSLRSTLDASEIGSRIPIKLDASRADFAGGLYADTVWNVMDGLQVTPGLRVDLYGSTGASGGFAAAIEPRLSSVIDVRPWLRLVQAHGFTTQRPSFFLPGPGFQPNLTGGLQRSFQTSAGVEADLPYDFQGKVTVFDAIFFNMTDAFGTSSFSDLVSPDSTDKRSTGSAYGVEISLKRRLTKRIGGFLSYTLSRSEREYDRVRLRAGTDRTHVLNATIGVDLGRGFRAGARVVYYSGFPGLITTSHGQRVDTGQEFPAFFRLDGRLEKKWTLGGTRWISAVLEMMNTTLSTEQLNIDCSGVTCKPTVVGPVSIPSIGVEGGL